MEFFTWKEQFSVSIPEMDQQHQKFFQMMNRIHQYNSRGEQDLDYLDELFRELYGYVLYHFDEEEKLLEMTGYDGLAMQKKQHQYFRNQLIEFRKQHIEGGKTVSQSVLNFMRDWFLNHILETDNHYGKYFQKA